MEELLKIAFEYGLTGIALGILAFVLIKVLDQQNNHVKVITNLELAVGKLEAAVSNNTEASKAMVDVIKDLKYNNK